MESTDRTASIDRKAKPDSCRLFASNSNLPSDAVGIFVQQAMMVQILLLAADLDVAFVDRVFVEAVRSEETRTA
jgi:hypothetical protein